MRGQVAVGGRIVRELGTQVDEDARVTVDGRPVKVAAEREVVALNKPPGVMTTMRDPQGRRTVADLLREARGRSAARLVPVGRLDYDTSGILLLTNDGDLAHALTHPRFGVEKVYRVTLQGILGRDDVARLREGIRLDDAHRTAEARLRVVAASRDRSVVDLTIHEGRYRQVRRMFEALHHPVVALERLRFGPVSLGALASGALRALTDRERRDLDAIVRAAREGTPDDTTEDAEA